MNATLLCVALLVPGYGEKDVIERIRASGGAGNSICLKWPKGTDDDLGELCELRHLRTLDLRNSKVTDRGLRTVSALHWLLYLGLSGTGITDNGLRRLESLPNLKHLYLEDCPYITDEGVARLQKALPKCEIYR
jgi:hypothetical protein